MPVQLVKVVNFGKSRSGLSTVAYAIFNADGILVTSRSTSGIYEITGGSGVYAAQITFSSSFNGSIVWDTGQAGANLLYASEQYNYLENNPNVDSGSQNTSLILSATILMTGSVLSGSTLFNIPTTISASDGFFTGYFIRVSDLASGNMIRPIEEYFSSSGTFIVGPAMPFTPTSGSNVVVISGFGEMFGRVG